MENKMSKRRQVILARVKIGELLDNNGHKFVSVQFRKKSGEWRTMNGRFKVTRHLRGGVNKVVAPWNAYKTIYDVQSKGYRTLNLDTVSCVRAGGVDYYVED